MIKEQLQFIGPIEGDAPEMTCNCCGKREVAKGWLMATIYPFVNQSCNFSTVVCSEKCREQLLKSEEADFLIIEAMCKISFKPYTGGLNAAYAALVDKYNDFIEQANPKP